jgi:copper resistance protein C
VGLPPKTPDPRLAKTAVVSEVSRMRLCGIFVGFLSTLLMTSTNGWTHAYPVKSSPARRAVLSRAPAQVQLWFNEWLEAQFSHLSVWDAAGKQVDSGNVQVEPDDPKQLSVGVPQLAPGTYKVRYRVLSVDGHVVESEFPFTLRRSP